MKKYALIGWEISTRLSEKIHRGNFAMDGLEATYDTLEIAPDEFDRRIPELLKEYDGLNVTRPYKERIIPFLTKLDESAKKYKSVNTVRRCECHGDTTGFNTDVPAFLELYGSSLVGMRILVVGAGGAGRPIAEALEKEVFDTKVANMNRVENAEALEQSMAAGELDVVINATPAELTFKVPDWVSVIDLRPDHGGERMLLLQARKSEELWNPKAHHHDHDCHCHGDHSHDERSDCHDDHCHCHSHSGDHDHA